MSKVQNSIILDYEVSYLSLKTSEMFFFDIEVELKKTLFLKCKSPPIDYFLYLYKTVGQKYEWTDWLMVKRHKLENFLSNESIMLNSLIYEGVPRGFYVLDFTKSGECDLAYFGLFEEIIGKGYGKLMMNSAFKSILEYGTIKTVTVNTNTLDHSNALPLYKKAGFKVTHVEKHNRKAFGEQKNRIGDLANV